jgi:DNA mismatch repair protein MutS2
LAESLLQYLADHAQLTIATTHYGELKALKYGDPRFENASVEFNDQTLSPTYRLLWGIPGRSNALTIAKRLGLDGSIVTAAQHKVGDRSTLEINQIITGLEEQRRQQESKAKEAEKLLEKAEKFYQEVSQKATNLQQREKELKISQELAIQTAITTAKEEIAQVIKRLQKGPQTAQAAGRATQAINQINEVYKPVIPPPPIGFKPVEGDRIRIPKLGQTAEVISVDQEQGNLVVKFGIMKMTVNLIDIESLQGEKPHIPKKSTEKNSGEAHRTYKPNGDGEEKPKPIVAVRTDRNTLDIRGSKVADAEIAIERAIDRAHALGTMWIIHGKGTGKLRQGVQDYLSKHPLFTHFETAPEKEGGGGVTIAYLK